MSRKVSPGDMVPKGWREIFFGHRLTVPLLLLLQLGMHLLLYYNTQQFAGISESGTLLGKLDAILSGERPKPLYGFYWYFTPSYIAFLLIRLFGTIDAYFIFQCLLATVTTFLIYRSVVLISDSQRTGIIAIILTTIYTEFLLLSSVFYNQVYENFFVALFFLLLLHFAKGEKPGESFLKGSFLVIIVTGSLLFRNTMLFIFFYLFIAGIYYVAVKQISTGRNFIILSLAVFVVVFLVKPLDHLREGAYKPPGLLEFWGHTKYGGSGGEVGFIYKENEELFNERLNEYLRQNDIAAASPEVEEGFKRYEVRRFITKEPHRWVLLQAKKVFYTFGIMPQRDGLTMLMTGRVNIGWVLAAFLLQLPFIFLIILFLLTVDIKWKDIALPSGFRFMLYLLGIYLVGAISVYGAYAERYRVVAMVAFIIPVTAINIDRLKQLFKPGRRKELIIRLSFIALVGMVWCYQAYEALILHRERYFQALDKIN